MLIERAHRTKPKIDIVPMIDVIFFLLVFFMLFTTFRTEPAGINVDLPKAVTGDKGQSTQIVVTVDKNGTKFLNGKQVSSTQLKTTVGDTLRSKPDTFVIVRADKTTRYEHVVSAIDDVREVGGYKLGLAVELDSVN